MIGPSIWYDLASRQVFWANLHKIFLGKIICLFKVSVRAAYCHMCAAGKLVQPCCGTRRTVPWWRSSVCYTLLIDTH